MSQADEDHRNVNLVISGYTVSTRIAAFAQIGDYYVMRNCNGKSASLAVDETDREQLYDAWVAIQQPAVPNATAKRWKDTAQPDQINWQRNDAESLNGTLTTRANTTVSLAVDRRPDGRWEWLAWRRGDTGNVSTGDEGDALWAMECAERAGHALLSRAPVRNAA